VPACGRLHIHNQVYKIYDIWPKEECKYRFLFRFLVFPFFFLFICIVWEYQKLSVWLSYKGTFVVYFPHVLFVLFFYMKYLMVTFCGILFGETKEIYLNLSRGNATVECLDCHVPSTQLTNLERFWHTGKY